MSIKGHRPVLLDETIHFFDRPETKVVLDATLGGAGHAEAILENIGSVVKLVGFDRDGDAIKRCQERLSRFGDRVEIHRANFFDIDSELDNSSVKGVDAILIDLGVSSFQFDNASRGFSFSADGPLDMRMDRRQEATAEKIVNEFDVKELARLFRDYGEERMAFQIAKAIVRERDKERIVSTLRLAEIVRGAYPKKLLAKSKIDVATKVFMALRIAVNQELSRLAEALENAIGRLNPGGRIAVIAFHSLEDRIVKRTFLDNTRRCVCPKSSPVCICGEPGRVRLVTKKPVTPGAGEISENPRSRSAKLRVAERLVN